MIELIYLYSQFYFNLETADGTYVYFNKKLMVISTQKLISPIA